MSKYNNIPIGSIVQVQGIESNNIYYTMIVGHNISFKDSKSIYDYVSIDYYSGFRGVAFFRHFNKNQVQKIISKKEVLVNFENKRINLPISSIIKHRGKGYLVVGINVKYLGKEKIKTYACIRYNKENSEEFKRKFKYVKENEITEVLSYGYENIEYLEYEKKRHIEQEEFLKKYVRLLPLGSIVTLSLKEQKQELDVMIVDRFYKEEETYYYAGVVSTGYKSKQEIVKFSKNNIFDIKYVGYSDNEEFEYMSNMLIEEGYMER